jgi:proline-specific peptidase
MYYYDQLGCNNSDQPDDAALWTLARYTAEVEEVRRGLGLEQFVLFGHSWGGILAMEYALHHQQHLRALVISNMTAGVQSFLKRASFLKSQLPPQTLARLTALEAKQCCCSTADPASATNISRPLNLGGAGPQFFGPDFVLAAGHRQHADARDTNTGGIEPIGAR